MRLLFVKESLNWPRSFGHDVHCYHMMRALVRLGHSVSLATIRLVSPDSVQGLELSDYFHLIPVESTNAVISLSRLQERFRSYWGIDERLIRAVDSASLRTKADAVVVVGLNVLPYLSSVRNALRIWYAADEWAWHHLSQVRLTQPWTWGNVKLALVKGLYERVYAPLLDRVWVVSEADRRAMAWVTGSDRIDVIPNGVDENYFVPRANDEEPDTCVFWGRLDFGPNVQALEWFCRQVWPELRMRSPAARFTIYGFQPTPAVEKLVGHEGIILIPNLPDLRKEVSGQAVVVLPFVSGGGIKNKLLEAAAMGKAIVCSPKACGGLSLNGSHPLCVVQRPSEWVSIITKLWSDRAERQRLGMAAWEWVVGQHTWAAAAETAAFGLEKSHRARQPA